MSNKKDNSVVRAAIAAVIVNEVGQLLAGVRRGSTGAGQLAFPGGSIHPGETLELAAEREVLEETGLLVRCLPYSQVQQELFLVNHRPGEEHPSHVLVVFLECRLQGGTLETREPERCEGWGWYSLAQLIDRAPPEAVAAWKEGRTHESLAWIPLPQLYHYRDHLGLSLSNHQRRTP